MSARTHRISSIIMIAAVLIILFALPAQAGADRLFVPLAPKAIDHFTDAQLTAAMEAAGYPPAQWDQYTSCAPDPAWTAADPLWLACWTALDTEGGTWSAGYVEYTPAMMSPIGVQWRVVGADDAGDPFGGSGITPVKRFKPGN